MKLNKRFLAVLVLVVMAFSLAACSGGNSGSIVGTWKMDLEGVLEMAGISKAEYDMVKGLVGDMEVTIEFTNNGRAIMRMKMMGETQTEESTYKVEGNQLYMDGEPGEFKLNGNKLTLTYDGQTMTLTRK